MHSNRSNQQIPAILSVFNLEIPTFMKELAPAEVVKDSTAHLECQVTGTSPFEITWYRAAKEIKSSAKHSFSQISGILGLEVHKCGALDVGEYQCTVANEVGSCTTKATLKLKGETNGESRFRVATDSLTFFCWFYVIEPPTFTKKIENTVTVLGKVAEFRCVVEGSPTLSAQWQKDDNWILEDPKIERTFENNVAILKIPACEAAHGGKYSCQVVNEAGQTKCSASLTVQGRYSTRRCRSSFPRDVMGDPLCFAH